MENSVTHKSKKCNTYRYKSFLDRINEIDLRKLTFYQIGHKNEELTTESNETYFHQTLKKWIVLNLSEEFSVFYHKVNKIVSLPQLLHQKDYVVDTLLEHIIIATDLSLQPLLELLYILAKDLREEFHPYFERILDRLVCLLNTQNAEQLEWIFTCFAYIFKYLKTYLKRNIGLVFCNILPLLDQQHFDEYINNFAIECFSFIARDVKDFDKFLDYILKTLTKHETHYIQACGRLLFEIVRGINGQFHVCAGDFLQLLFEKLIIIDDEKYSNLLMAIVSQMISNALIHIHPLQFTLLWEKLCQVTDKTIDAVQLINIVKLYQQITNYKDGKYLTDMNIIVPSILRMVDKALKTESTLQLLSNLITTILMCGCGRNSVGVVIAQLDTNRLIRKGLTIRQRSLYEEFIRNLIYHPQFDIYLLPSLIEYFEEKFDIYAHNLLAEVILQKFPLQFDGTAEQNTKFEKWNITLKRNDTLDKIEKVLHNLHSNVIDLPEDKILLLIIAQHLKDFNAKTFENILKNTQLQLLQNIKQLSQQPNGNMNNTRTDVNNYIGLLVLIVSIQYQFKYACNNHLNDLIDVLLQNQTHSKSLGCLNQLITMYSQHIERTPHLVGYLTKLLAHHDRQKKLLAAHSLWQLYNECHNPYAIFYRALCIEPNVYTFRDQLVYVKQLQKDGELFKTFQYYNDYDRKEHCLLFLLGLLYNNFKDIWEPVQKLLQEYCHVMDANTFWSVYYDKMVETVASIKEQNDELKDDATLYKRWSSKVLQKYLSFCLTNEAQINHQQLYNYRILLWQSLPKFGKILESKNRDLVNMFLIFIKDEYKLQINETNEFTWNLLKCDDEMEVKQNQNTIRGHEKSKSVNISNKILMRTIEIKLHVLSTYNNPKALYREPELWSFYMNLIQCNNTALQKSALDCIMAYKMKAIVTYKDSLYNILDEKKFRNELLNFKINETVSREHRSTFCEIFLRLLYGKMTTKGNKKGISNQQRKSIILRFLGDCNIKEIEYFVEMSYMPYKHYLEASVTVSDIPILVKENLNYQSVWSAKKLQSALNLWELLRKEIGGRMQKDFHMYMLKLLVFIGSVCQEVIQFKIDDDKIHPKLILVYRNVKQNCLQCVLNFFMHFENFEWSDNIIESLTNIFVYPAIEKLPQECIHTPTLLLKLLLQWGSKPKHFKFLLQKQLHTVETIFCHIIKLLMNEKIKVPVRKSIMTLIERLLIACNDTDIGHGDSENALALIEPFVPELLQHLKGRLRVKIKGKLLLDKQDLNVLSMLTILVKDSATCDQLLQILLPILVNKCQTQATIDIINQIIHTLSNLIKQLNKPELYIRKLAPFFEYIQEVSARKDLCNLITDIVRTRSQSDNLKNYNSNELIKIGRTILLLNAWDKRWVEQPDYNKRLQGFEEIEQSIKDDDNTVNMDLGVLVVYNCIHFLRYGKDMALRDNASDLLRLLFPYLATKYHKQPDELMYLMNDVFMPFMREALRSNQDNLRNEGLRLLGVMVKTSSNYYSMLKDLYPLTDIDTDMENDFFENLTHLQSYMHGRALLKFCSYAATLTEPIQIITLTRFLLPIASFYLFKEQYAANHTLIDATIETIGIICQLLPWQHYQAILKYYLMKLRTSHDYQKQCVRIVIRVLDAFHYNLCLGEVDSNDLEELKMKMLNDNQNNIEEDNKLCLKEEKMDKTSENGCDIAEPDTDVSATNEDVKEDNIDDDNLDIKNIVELTASNINPHEICSKSYILNEHHTLTANAAKKVLNTITVILIPTLHRSITENTAYDNKHKLNRKRFNVEHEEEEILRVPIALALIKLMQKLPKNILDNSLSGVLMKVCMYLRSSLISVRRYTRDILKKILMSLGSEYLGQLMNHLQALLTRGFQVHVLSVTVYGILEALRDKIQPEHLECCMTNILEVALNDIFGDINVDKDMNKLQSRTPEAKPSAKSYLVLQIVALNIREKCLLDLLMPFREYLSSFKSRKLTLKIQECFNKIISGLVENRYLSFESLLIFIHGTISESIHDLLPRTENSKNHKEKDKIRSFSDCFIIPAEPGRRSIYMANKIVKTNTQVNAHILIEFGSELLYNVLKRKKIKHLDYEPYLNPLIVLLRDSLKSSHIRVIVYTIKCFTLLWMDEYKLSSLEVNDNIKCVVERLFDLLKNFSNFGVTKHDDNLQLIQSTFKAIVALLEKCNYYELTEEQVDQITLHIEEDLKEADNQTSITFSLLEALLRKKRKINTSSMTEIIKRIREISIVSQSDFIRSKARSTLIIYIMECCEYPKVEQMIKTMSVQLVYVTPAGRLSVIEFFDTIIKKMPLNVLSKFASFLYVSLATRLVNDIDPECRKAVALCIENMLKRLDKVNRQDFFNITLQFFKAHCKPSVREMGAALCSRFVNVEKDKFSKRLNIIIPRIIERLTHNPTGCGRYVKTHRISSFNDSLEKSQKPKKTKLSSNDEIKKNLSYNLPLQEDNDTKETQIVQQQALDHELLQLQYCLLKIFHYCLDELLKNSSLYRMIDELAYESQRLLAHDHTGVRSNAIKTLIYIISSYNFDAVGSKLLNKPVERNEDNENLNYIYTNPEYDIKSLVLDLCAQVEPGETTAATMDDICKLFLFIATMLKDIPLIVNKSLSTDEGQVKSDTCDITRINLYWFMRNIRYLINKEVTKANNSTTIRHGLFTLLEGLIALLPVEVLKHLTSSFLTVLVREMSDEDQNVDPDIKQLALRVGSRLRQKIGTNVYTKKKIDAEMKLKERRAERRRILMQEKVRDPERATKRRSSMQHRKRLAKKAKTDIMRGKITKLNDTVKLNKVIKRKRMRDGTRIN